ncbi:MAG: autotransporter-associated beta strand repeat-containing protein [Akkermansiaceae bacterium]|nr:autotransporter-associated beta strand repeat-containing protein [Akkermansiaceae bacterium]
MKPNHKNRLLLAAISLTLTAPSAFAAALTWDKTSGDGATISAGSGDWNLTAGNTVWNNGTSNVIWSQTLINDGSNTATFAGTDGTLNQYVITLAAQMATDSITFNNSGYQITGSTLAIMPTTTTAGAITVAAGKTATINSAIAYGANAAASIVSNAGSTLNLGGGASNAQYTFSGAGTVNMTAGAYSANIGAMNAATLNQTGGTFTITPGNALGYYINSTSQNVAYNLSGGTVSVNGNAITPGVSNAHLGIGNGTGVNTSALNVSGTGVLSVGTATTKSGEIRIANTTASNGTLNVTGGTVTVGTGSAANQIYFFKAGSGAGFTSAMTQSAGTVTANGIQFGGSTGATTYDGSSAANLTLSGGSLYIGAAGITKGTDAATLAATIKLQGGTLGAEQNWTSSLNMQLGATSGGPTFQAASGAAVSRNITLSGILSNDTSVSGTLTKTGAGTLTLSGANTFSGGLTIKNGTVNALVSSDALGSGTVTLGGVGSTGGILLVGRAFTNNFTVNAPDSGTSVIGANGGGSAYILSGGIALNSNLNIRTFDNAISGTTIATGTITGGITGTGNVLLNNYGLAANTLAITTNAINNVGSLTLQGTATGDTIISANIGSNVTSVTQNSATSRLILSGANTYTGATTVSAGTLAVNGSLANTSTTVGTGGTLQGSGSMGGSVTVQSGGKIAAGNSIESLATGALSLLAGSTFAYELNNDAAAGVAGDLTAVTGSLTFDVGNTVLLTLTELGTGSWSNGDKLTLLSYSGAWNGGLFNYASSTLADDSTFTFSSMEWAFNYNDAVAGTNYTGDLTGSSFVTMTAIPEPNAAALVGGLGALALLRRRRK